MFRQVVTTIAHGLTGRPSKDTSMSIALTWKQISTGLAIILAYGPAVVGAGDWPQFLGPERNGISRETGLQHTWPAAGPTVVWQKEVGEGYSGPVVQGNRLILFHRVGNQEVVECLEVGSGKGLWKYEATTAYRDQLGKGDGPRSTPLIVEDRVYTLGAEGRLSCLNLESGQRVWERSLQDDYRIPPSYFGVGTSPLAEGSSLLLNVGSRGAGIVALAKETGKEIWKATDQGASYSSPVAATIDGVRHVFFLTRDGLVSVDPTNGAVRFSKRWRARYNASVNAATPLVFDSHLFLSASYNTGAIILRVAKDGVEEVWKGDNILSNHYTTSIHHGDYLYGLDGRQEEGARLRAVEWKTGRVMWTQEHFGCGSMILADGHLIILTEDGDLVLVEATPTAYREKARAHLLGKGCRAQLALANGFLYARDNDKLICLTLKN
jgi:outer membrane protein assembly factor BamB